MWSLTCRMACDTKNVINAESVHASAATLPTLQHPRVIDIMAEELSWNAARRRQEMKHTTHFLQSMGLPPGPDVPAPARSSQHWYDWAYRIVGTTATTNSHGRAQFEAGEADSLREAFLEQSRESAGRLDKPAVREPLHGIPAYTEIRTKDFEYVLEETGLAEQELVDMDEFVEVRAASFTDGGFADGFFRECVWISCARNLRMCRGAT